MTINGLREAAFHNTLSSSGQGNVTINVDVVGKGIFQLELGATEFAKSVTADQQVTVGNGATLRADHPRDFDANVSLFNNGEIDLIGLARADSYSFKNDMLSIFSGHKVIDTLRLRDQTSYGFVVQQTAGSVNIVSILDPSNPPTGLQINT